MPKQKITISLDSDIAKKLRTDSIKKYGDARSMSRLIEDLATGAAATPATAPATSENLPVKKEECKNGTIIFHNGVDIGGMNPNSVFSQLFMVELSLRVVNQLWVGI